LEAFLHDTAAVGFAIASEAKTGALLWALAAAQPGGRLLELGTGTDIATVTSSPSSSYGHPDG
jgi:hypothetical protein